MQTSHSHSFNLNNSLACHMCGITMQDLYEGSSDWDECGLHGDTDNKGLPTKLWMTSCNHIVCVRHLPGGIVPFTPNGGQPSVSCPLCPSQHKTRLFWIRGTSSWQHDASIPEEYFAGSEVATNQSSSIQSSVAAVHAEGAKAAARLYAAQTQAAASLIRDYQERISILETENASLAKAMSSVRPLQGLVSTAELSLPTPRTLHSWGTKVSEPSRLTLKRPINTSSPETRNVRRRIPERGTLVAFRTPQQDVFARDLSIPRIEEVDAADVGTSPAFSTPCLRTNLSPGKKSNCSASALTPHKSSNLLHKNALGDGPTTPPHGRRFDRSDYT